jgi:hypothetical protein
VSQDLADLRTEVVRVRELHDSTAPPSVGGRAGIPVHGNDAVTTAAESRTEDESGRTGADDENLHGEPPLHW